MTYYSALTALADPTRRAIFELLSSGPRTVGDLAHAAQISQPAASQHLRVLAKARLVGEPRRDGTRRYYQADPAGLAELRSYIEAMWSDVLTAYARGGVDSERNNDGHDEADDRRSGAQNDSAGT
jgi:DNA-binding transcriptional ArsR family regulator